MADEFKSRRIFFTIRFIHFYQLMKFPLKIEEFSVFHLKRKQ